MKKFMCHYPVPFFCKGDVVYDANQHILLVVTRVLHNPTLPIFKVIDTEYSFAKLYVNCEMPLTYSSEIKHLQYVCKKSSLSRFRRNFLPFTDVSNSPLYRFLRNFKALCSCEK